jgi:L-fucose isomerase-like protein
MQAVTLGLIVGNRGFFPAHLCEKGRQEMLTVLQRAGHKVVALTPQDTTFGSIENLNDARKCADLLRAHADQIDGLLVTLPNFGDERAVANAIRWSGLRVPVLIHAFPDTAGHMTIADRRDSFCGKMSVCNNLRQYGIPFTLTRLHTDAPTSATFTQDVADFATTCRVVRGLRHLRIGALGARPAAFNTVRYSEKLLEQAGISVETLDLFECFGRAEKLKDQDPAVVGRLNALKGYVKTDHVPPAALMKMAKFAAVVEQWMKDAALDATAIQCWTAMEEYYGVVPCAVMSLLSNSLLPSACEVDVVGAVAMAALAKASGKPAALVDWNNNYGTDPDKGVVFHCSNLPKDIFSPDGGGAKMDYQAIIAGAVGQENAYGTILGRVAAAPFTYLRVGTDDQAGKLRAYVGEGELTNDPLETFGGYGVVRIPNFQKLLRHICETGFEHHVAITPAPAAQAVYEALTKYLGWDVYFHQ